MTRKLWILGIVAVLGLSAAVAGFGVTHRAAACDDVTKTAGTAPSCCARGADNASVSAKDVHNSMIKSAVVAPGAAPILNVAAFGAMLSHEKDNGCQWCPRNVSASACAGEMSASECAAHMSAADCAGKMSASQCPFLMQQQGAATTADYKGCTGGAATTTTADFKGCPGSAAATVASTEHAASSDGSVAMAHDGCTGSAVTADSHSECMHSASAAGHEGCDKSMAAAAGCCGGKAAGAEAQADQCEGMKTTSLKGVVDEMPYAESKRVVLTGSYACGHCTLQKTAQCAPMLKTADGKVYPLVENSHASELRLAEGKSIQVSGNVKRIDGVKYLDVKSYKLM